MQAQSNSFYRRLADLSIRYRYLVVALYGAATAYLGYQAVTSLVVDNSTEAFVVADSGPAAVLDGLIEDFGSDQFVQVVVGGDVFSRPFLQKLETLHGELSVIDVDITKPIAGPGGLAKPDTAADLEWQPAQFGDFGDEGWGEESGGTVIDETLSLSNARDIRVDEHGSLVVDRLLNPIPDPAVLVKLKARILADPSLVGRVVGRAGRHAVVLLRLVPMSEDDSRKVDDAALAIASRFDTPGFEVHVGGVPSMNTVLNRTMSRDMAIMSVLSLLIAGLVLLYLFRHLLAALGPALVIGQAFCWVLGLMALSGVPLTMVTTALPAFLTAVGLGDAIHIQSTYRDARVRGMENRAAICHALGHTGTPIAYTSITTMIGLVSFRFASLPAIQDLGVFGALGVFFAFALSTTLLPALLHFNKTSVFGAKPVPGADVAAGCPWACALAQPTEHPTGARHSGAPDGHVPDGHVPDGHAPDGHVPDGQLPDGHVPDGLDRFLAWCSGLSAPVGSSRVRQRNTLAVGGVLLLGMLASLTQLQVYHNIMAWFPEGMPLKVATETLDSHVGGTASVVVLVEPAVGRSLAEPELLLAMERFERDVLAYDDVVFGTEAVSNITSVLDLVRETHRALHGGDPEYFSIPNDRRAVRDILTLLESADGELLRQVLTVDMARSMMAIRVRWMDASGYEPLVAHLEQAIERDFAGIARVEVTGSVHNLFWVVVRLLDDLLRSFSLAFVVITVVMLVLLRDLKLGLLAMVPNLMPVAAILTFMVWTGIPIDINNLMVASVAIGIAVDDTIHFLHQFQTHYRQHQRTEAAIAHAFSTTGRAMVSTTMIMAAGFSVFLFATLINMQRFGMLMILTVLAALIIDLVFAPALLRALYRNGDRALSRT